MQTGETDARAAAFPYTDQVRIVPAAAVGRWLALGWRDMRAAGWISPAYGMIFVVIGFFITGGLVMLGMPYLITPMIGSFLLVGPLLALGLYDVSMRLEQGLRPGFLHALFCWRRNTFHILTAGLLLMLATMIWARLSIVLFALFFPYQSMSLDSFIAQMFTLPGLIFTVFMIGLGAVFAAAAFVTNMIALPMMLDRRMDVFAAALASVVAVVKNPKTSALWAGVIVLIVGLGMATAFLGLAVALPLIGHASWHAYRDFIVPSAQQDL